MPDRRLEELSDLAVAEHLTRQSAIFLDVAISQMLMTHGSALTIKALQTEIEHIRDNS